jgi:hypothetical protein
MNDLRALVDDATPEGAPGFDGVLARRSQRSRRRRGVIAGAGAAVLLAVTSLAVQLGPSDGDQRPAPAPAPTISPTESSSPTPTPIDRPDPTYTWSDTPPRVVLRTPDRDVRLTTWLGCWNGPSGNLDCVEEAPAPVAELPDIGSPDHVDFWFGVKGWTFDAEFTQLGSDCPRSESTKTVSTSDRWFRLDPAGLAGDYRVTLSGYGTHSEFKGVPTQMSFIWHTPADGPVDQPKSHVSDASLALTDLGFRPTSATAHLTITDANGETTTRQLPWIYRDECESGGQGWVYFEGDFLGPEVPELGPSPYRYRVRLTLDGKTYIGTGTSKAGAYVDPIGAGPGTGTDDVVWSPPLPAYPG